MDDLNNVLKDVYVDHLADKPAISVTEIGTGSGENSTRVLYNFFSKVNKPFRLLSYEGEPKLHSRAHSVWQTTGNVLIKNEYFSDKEDIVNLLIPNIPDHITDYNESGDRLKGKYMDIYRNFSNPLTEVLMGARCSLHRLFKIHASSHYQFVS